MSNPKRQHWVPRFYLREFAIPSTGTKEKKRVWVFSRKHEDSDDPIPVNIEKVAAEKFIYSPADKAGKRSFEVEKILSLADSALASHWPRIADGLPDLNRFQGIRRSVAWLAAILLARHPDRMGDATRFHQTMLRIMRSGSKDARGVPEIEKLQIGTKVFEFDPSDWESYRDASDAELRRVFGNSIKPLTIKLTETLLRKTWTIVVSHRPIFVTSDRPVYYHNTKTKPFGLDTPGTIIFFPISPTRLLIMHDEGDGSCRYQHLRQRDALGFNLLTWVHARRFLISQFKPSALLDKMVEESAKFDRIQSNNRRQSVGKIGRNSPCPCGSGRKFKYCCGSP